MNRLREGRTPSTQSWIDLFFTKDIHVIGLTLDFVETDLWWLLTYRARSKFYQKGKKQKLNITNRITYYIPEKYALTAKYKLEVLEANDVIVKIIPQLTELKYYHQVLNQLV